MAQSRLFIIIFVIILFFSVIATTIFFMHFIKKQDVKAPQLKKAMPTRRNDSDDISNVETSQQQIQKLTDQMERQAQEINRMQHQAREQADANLLEISDSQAKQNEASVTAVEDLKKAEDLENLRDMEGVKNKEEKERIEDQKSRENIERIEDQKNTEDKGIAADEEDRDGTLAAVSNKMEYAE